MMTVEMIYQLIVTTLTNKTLFVLGVIVALEAVVILFRAKYVILKWFDFLLLAVALIMVIGFDAVVIIGNELGYSGATLERVAMSRTSRFVFLLALFHICTATLLRIRRGRVNGYQL